MKNFSSVGPGNALVAVMLIAFLCWIVFSTVFCLAFFFVAARPMSNEEQTGETEWEAESAQARHHMVKAAGA